MAAWYRAAGYADTEATVGVSVDELAAAYWGFGAMEGVRPEVAWVQAVVETGGFTNRDSRELNNFAGIGHCDSCPQGMPFLSYLDGVIAHVQLLKRVVWGNDVEMVLPVVAPTWGGRQASTLEGLARNWASDPIYATTLTSVLGQLLASGGVELVAAGTDADPSGGCIAADGYAFPLPPASITDPGWLTKPHHDYPAADIPVVTGTEVYAPVAGEVISAPTGGACGLGVLIRDDTGVLWSLCHGSDGGELVTPGDRVAAGQLVMHSASTGNSTGPHLHLGIELVDGSRVCPQSWLDALWRADPVPAIETLATVGCTN